MRLRLLVAVAATVLSITSAAHAATAVNIEASGTFASNVDMSSISSPGASWSLSLTILNPPVGSFISDTFTVQYNGSTANNIYGLGAIYKLNGATVASDPVDYIYFYDQFYDGGVDFKFHDGNFLSLYLGDIGSSGTISTGSVNINEDLNDEYFMDPSGHSALDSSGTLVITDTTVEPVTPPAPAGTVPEPATWAFMVLGLGMVGAALRRRPQALAA